jgi:3-deoxy-manno-octulosonate cytidylyltransferase (CMP-KDO synthetase)
MKNNQLKVCVIIPARFESSRFPGKPLVKLNKIPMVVRVAQLSSKAVGKNNVFVATDDIRIVKEVELSGFKAIITSSSALTGTDRVAEAATQLNYDIYINVQGDEPLLDFNDIIKCIDLKVKFPKHIINGYTEISEQENPESVNIPKVITNEKNFLVYMSRKSLPGFKEIKNKPKFFKKQVCIYGFNKQQLFDFNSFGNKSVLEHSEDIEILRFFEFDYKILMYECQSGSLAVDTPEDIAKVEQVLKENENL